MIIVTGRDAMATSHPALLHVRVLVRTRHHSLGRLGLKAERREKGDLRPARAGAKRNPFCVMVACRSVLAGRPGQRRCHPVGSLNTV